MKKVGTTLRGDVGGFSVITSQTDSRNRITSFPPTPQSRIEAMRIGAGCSNYTSTGKYETCTSFSSWRSQ